MTSWRTGHLFCIIFSKAGGSQGAQKYKLKENKTYKLVSQSFVDVDQLKCCHLPEQHPSPGSHANCAGGSECARHRVALPPSSQRAPRCPPASTPPHHTTQHHSAPDHTTPLQDAQRLPPHLTTSQRTKPQIEQRPKSNKKFPINKCQDVCYLIRYPRAPGQ